MKLALAIGVCVSLLLSATGVMERTTLPYGSQLIVRRDASVPTVAVELWFRVPSIGFDSPTPGIARYAATAIAASKLGADDSVSTMIKNVGGKFEISAYPDAIAVAASVPAGSESRILRAMSAAYFTPVITPEGMRAGLRDVVVAGTQARFDFEQTLRDAVFGLLFPTGPAHYPTEPINATALGGVTQTALQAFAARAFRSSNAVIAVAGNTSADLTKSISSAHADGLSMLEPIDSSVGAVPAATSRPFPQDGVGLGWIGPPIADAKAATALDFISDYLFRADTGVVARSAQTAAPDAFLSGQFVTLHNPGVLLVEIAGTQTALVRAQVMSALQKMQTPLDQSEFAAARAAFEYHILADSQTPLSQADNFGWYTVEGDTLYAPSDDGHKYLSLVRSLDPAYVAQIAARYLGAPVIAELKGTQK